MDKYSDGMPRGMFLLPQSLANNEDMKELLHELAIPEIMNQSGIQRFIASGKTLEHNPLLLACIGNNSSKINSSLNFPLIHSLNKDEIDTCLLIAISFNITNPDQSIIERLFKNRLLYQKGEIDADLAGYISFAQSKTIKNKKNYVVESLTAIKESNQNFQDVKNLLSALIKAEKQPKSNSTELSTTLTQLQEKIGKLGIHPELGKFFFACIANDDTALKLILPKISEDMINFPKNNKHFMGMCLYDVIANNMGNKNQSIVQSLFENPLIAKSIDYDAQDYISFAESKNTHNTHNYALQTLQEVAKKYPQMKAGYTCDAMQLYTAHFLHLKKNQIALTGQEQVGILGYAWGLGCGVVQSGTDAIKYGAATAVYGAQQVKNYSIQAVQSGTDLVRYGVNSVTGYATNTYTQLSTSIYDAFPSRIRLIESSKVTDQK